jgi:hypothetical protein
VWIGGAGCEAGGVCGLEELKSKSVGGEISKPFILLFYSTLCLLCLGAVHFVLINRNKLTSCISCSYSPADFVAIFHFLKKA